MSTPVASEATKILNELGDALLEVEESDIQESVYPAEVIQDGSNSRCAKVQVETAATLMKVIMTEIGKPEADDFQNFILFGKIPSDPSKLVEFFKVRTDVISKFCLSRLTESGDHGILEV